MTTPSPALRTCHVDEFDAVTLAQAKGDTIVSIVIPARDEESTVGDIVAAIEAALVGDVGLVDEVLVVDDRSTDRTAERAERAGARVVRTKDVLPEVPGGRGKGNALWRGVAAATGDVIAFVDGDVVDFDPRFVVGLLGPLLDPRYTDVTFVKAFYERPLNGAPRGGGRVTELAARPILAILHPRLADVVQPLAGEFAARRTTLEAVPFIDGYGVDIGLLIDTAELFGVETLVQVDLGRRVHRNRPLAELGPMATEVLAAALARADVEIADEIRLHIPGHEGVVFRPSQRPPLNTARPHRE